MNEYKGTNVRAASTVKVVEFVEEIFKPLDLNDNNSKDFHNFIKELKNRVMNYEKEIKEIKTSLVKTNKAKDYYKKKLIDSMKKSDLSKLIEELVE